MVDSGKLRLTAYVFLGILCGSMLLNAVASFNFAPLVLQYETPGFNRFRSEAELKWFLEEKAKDNIGYGWEYGILGGVPGIIRFTVQTDATKSGAEQATGNDYSTTNIQVAGVDEADIVKTDGTYIYLSQGDTVYIVKAYPAEEAKVVAKIKFSGEVTDLYIAGDKLVVFTPGYGRVFATKIGGSSYIPMTETTTVYFYDVSDRLNPVLDRTYEVEGSYVATRMIGNFVYVVSQKGAWIYEGAVDLPSYRENGSICRIPASSVYYYNGTDPGYAYTTIASINTQDATFPIQSQTFLLGSSSTIYCSAEFLYLTTGGYSETGVHKIRLDDGVIEGIADGSVPGWILNQFSMDEHDGYFRIATTTGHAWGVATSKNNVYVLDPEMKVLGTLEDLAPGEQIYSTRFMGDRLYMVTFKKVDPLFVIDLSEPTAPRVLGKLKIPGYSNYLHPYDETHVIGLGKEAVDAAESSFAWYQGVKLSLFDVSDVENPREVAKLEIGDRGTDSPALYDHKAFLFSRERNLLVIPILEAQLAAGYETEPNAYGDYVYQGAYVFEITAEGITLRGKITHLRGDELLKSGYWFDSNYSVYRSLYIGENLYTISGAMVKINSLADLSELKAIALE
jgi:inhibitor of cysteine peptidase